ncbi:putative RDD family membrane protein YckC [Kitasatospora sp. MAP12-15]|uniref:RDD family protein n=1 Tax=unclassified Kitasatospora TaxID=2633591 RepID=UPI002475132C|nr:RDD family protein [Kitasatospora sp. MAP12-44]MDH6110906.1 putative RDD family membrane protein YckC [Kitasatospora sp. MAP12-44]
MSNPYDSATTSSGYQPNLDPAYDYHSGYNGQSGPTSPPVLASWGRRAAGYLLDWLICTIPAALLMLTPAAKLSNLVGIVATVVLGRMEGTTGQSPGKKVMGIQVLREADGQLLGWGQAVRRRFLHILDALCCLIGFLWPLWDAKGQTFADKIVGSVVIRTK